MTEISEMSKDELEKYIKDQESSILLADLVDCFHFDIARLPVMYEYPNYFNAIYYEILRRLRYYEKRNKVIYNAEKD